jgi:cold-inducible RNA-binding protein
LTKGQKGFKILPIQQQVNFSTTHHFAGGFVRLFVGNMPYDYKEYDLKQLFYEIGVNPLRVEFIKDKLTERFKGFGFVDTESDSDGKLTIDALNGKKVQFRHLTVATAKQREPRKPRDPRDYRRDSRAPRYRSISQFPSMKQELGEEEW